MNYREPLFRPPSEANSLIFQVAYSCPHNRCTFCQMYKGGKYQLRPLDEILSEIEWAGKNYPRTKRIFLADGDVMFLKFEILEQILVALNSSFPSLARVNTYANGSSINSKTEGNLKRLRELKLNTLYMGLETGDDELLKLIKKGEKADLMTKAVQTAQGCGFRCSVMALLGIGGQSHSDAHVRQTVECLNRMQPRFLATLRFIRQGNSEVFPDYTPVTEFGAVEELLHIVEGLELDRTVFSANHASNPVPIKGRLPQDKDTFIQTIQRILDSGTLDESGGGYMPMWL